MSTEWGISLSTTRIDEKSNEIPELQRVMKQMDCRGCIVTADAMNTQKETAKTIVKEAKGRVLSCTERQSEESIQRSKRILCL